MQQTVLDVALRAVAEQGYILVAHPTGWVMAAGGGATDWPAMAAAYLCPTSGSPAIVNLPEVVAGWNRRIGGVSAESWEPTHISVISAASGHRVAMCELTNQDALLHALLTILVDGTSD